MMAIPVSRTAFMVHGASRFGVLLFRLLHPMQCRN